MSAFRFSYSSERLSTWHCIFNIILFVVYWEPSVFHYSANQCQVITSTIQKSILGRDPYNTCLAYRNGLYNEDLLELTIVFVFGVTLWFATYIWANKIDSLKVYFTDFFTIDFFMSICLVSIKWLTWTWFHLGEGLKVFFVHTSPVDNLVDHFQ